MTQFLGVFRYIILRSLNNLYLILVFLLGIVFLIIYMVAAQGIDFQNAYPSFNAFNFLVLLVLGAGIIGGEIASGHIELIFTKPIKRGLFFFYKYLGTLTVSFLLILLFAFFSVLTSIFLNILFGYSLPDFSPLFKLILYLTLNQITTLSLLFFISSWTSGTLNSFLLLGGVLGYPLLSYFLISKYPSLNELLPIIKDILNPFKIELFLAKNFSIFGMLFHCFLYPISLLAIAILIINKKELSK